MFMLLKFYLFLGIDASLLYLATIQRGKASFLTFQISTLPRSSPDIKIYSTEVEEIFLLDLIIPEFSASGWKKVKVLAWKGQNKVGKTVNVFI